MAGSLILLSSTTASDDATITITGLDSTTYNVYVLHLIAIAPSADANFYMRVTTGGTADSDSEYDKSSVVRKSTSSGSTTTDDNTDYWRINSTVGTDTGETTNHIIHLFNFSNSSEYSMYTNESAKLTGTGSLEGYHGGGAHTVGEANNGVQFYFASGNIESGTFNLYGLKK